VHRMLSAGTPTSKACSAWGQMSQAPPCARHPQEDADVRAGPGRFDRLAGQDGARFACGQGRSSGGGHAAKEIRRERVGLIVELVMDSPKGEGSQEGQFTRSQGPRSSRRIPERAMGCCSVVTHPT